MGTGERGMEMNVMQKAPVVVFVYKRLDKTKKCLEALEENHGAEETEVFIFSDGAKGTEDRNAVQEVRDFLEWYEKKHSFKSLTVCLRETNWGLARSIIYGVTEIISQYGKAIVVEDDLITSRDFLDFLNGALEYYADSKKIGEISAFTYPLKGLETYEEDIYITRKADCWGWATWKDRWELADWEMKSYPIYRKKGMQKEFEKLQKGIHKMLRMQMKGELDSWAVRWCYSLFMKEMLTVYPKVSRTRNIGFDGSGVHCGVTDHDYRIYDGTGTCVFKDLDVESELEREAAVFEYVSLAQKVKNFGKRCLKHI